MPCPERYTPNTFARIGLCLLTSVIVLAAMGLLALVTGSGISSTRGWGVYCIFWGLTTYVVLEVFIQQKHHYRSGVDDALLFFAVVLTGMGIFIVQDISDPNTLTWVIGALLCGYGAWRCTNSLMVVLCLGCCLAAIFCALPRLPALIVIAAFSLSANLLAEYAPKRGVFALRYASLVALYGSLNYYVVGETASPHAIFWMPTFLIPLAYLFLGIVRRSRPALHTGMAALAATVLTFRYYHHILPLEQALTLGGVILMGLGYGLSRYLSTPRQGITSEALSDEGAGLELLAVTQAFGARTAVHDSPDGPAFGGGSFGGGGAGGDY